MLKIAFPLIIQTIASILFVAMASSGPEVSASAPRSNPSPIYARIPANLPTRQPGDFFDDMKVITTPTAVTIHSTANRYPFFDNARPLTVDGFTFQDGDQTISLVAMAVAYPSLTDSPKPTKPSFFSMDGRPLTLEDVQAQFLDEDEKAYIAQNTFLPVTGIFPNIRIYGKVHNAPIEGYHIFDKRTGANLSVYSARTWCHSMFDITLEPLMLHAAPIEIMIDVALGPETPYLLSPRVGADISARGLDVRMVAVSGRIKQPALFSRLYHLEPTKQGATYFMALADAWKQPFRFADHSARGVPMEMYASGSVYFLRTETPLAADDHIVLYQKEAKTRLIFTIPSLPGIPKVNQQITNLADVALPDFRVDNLFELTKVIEYVMQTEIKDDQQPKTADKFPKTFKGATAGDVLKFYMTLHPEPKSIDIKPGAMVIGHDDSPYHPLWVKELFN